MCGCMGGAQTVGGEQKLVEKIQLGKVTKTFITSCASEPNQHCYSILSSGPISYRCQRFKVD